MSYETCQEAGRSCPNDSRAVHQDCGGVTADAKRGGARGVVGRGEARRDHSFLEECDEVVLRIGSFKLLDRLNVDHVGSFVVAALPNWLPAQGIFKGSKLTNRRSI